MAPKPTAKAADLGDRWIYAVGDGDWGRVAALLQCRGGLQAGQALTGTADALLPLAGTLGHADMIERLLAAGFGVDDSTHYGCTALWMVAFHKPPHALRCIDILLSKGANLNATSRELTTPLAMAAMEGHLDICQRLLAAGADVNVRTNLKDSALYLACQEGHPEVVQLLLDAGADINITTNDGATVLTAAAAGGSTEAVSALLAAGAGSQLEAPSYTGLRPLQCAADFLRADTVAQLLQLGARVDVRDSEGKTPLMGAVVGLTGRIVEDIWKDDTLSDAEQLEEVEDATADCEEVIDQLLCAGADPNVRWRQQYTPLLYAAHGSPAGPYCGVLRKLLAAGADLYATTAVGASALDIARLAMEVDPKHLPALQLLEAAASTQPPPAAYRAAPPRFTLSTASINAPANAGPSARVSLWLAPEVTLPPAQGAALSAAPAVPAAATPVPTATVRVPAAAAGAAKQCAVCGKGRREGDKPLLKCGRCKATYYCSTACQTSDWPSHKHTCKSGGASQR